MGQLQAPILYFIVSTGAFTTLAVVVSLVMPQVLRPGGSLSLVGITAATIGAAALAVRAAHRSQRPPVWWAWWSMAVLTATGTVVADPGVRQLVALSTVVGPVYGAMFMPLRRVLALMLASGAAMAVLAASTDGPWPVRVLRIGCSLTVASTLVCGLVVLRRQLDRSHELAADASRRDPLTGLLNRRGVQHYLPELLDSAASQGRIVVAVVADIDRFKTVNDTFGHAVGDAVLIAVAKTLQRSCRGSDLLARLGGEELLLVSVVERDDAAPLAERLRRDIADADGKPAVTISVGAAWSMIAPRWASSNERGGRSAAADALLGDLVHRADVLMYAAKEGGRNRALTEE